MKPILALLLLLQCLWLAPARADEALRLQVAEPYLDLRTGPGAHFPVTQVVERGEWITVEGERGGWIRVTAPGGLRGWVSRADLERTLAEGGAAVELARVTGEDYARRRWELGFLAGAFEGADLYSLSLAFAFQRNLSLEVGVGQALGRYSDSALATVALISQPFPRWRLSPYFVIGGGTVRSEPRTVLIRAEKQDFNAAHAGIGVRAHLTRRFMVRLEYKSHVLFVSDENNEEMTEWKAGFAVFF